MRQGDYERFSHGHKKSGDAYFPKASPPKVIDKNLIYPVQISKVKKNWDSWNALEIQDFWLSIRKVNIQDVGIFQSAQKSHNTCQIIESD
jgi:hypothetical protein